jgi:hypothetical protein
VWIKLGFGWNNGFHTRGQLSELADELSKLSKQQSIALQQSAYLSMSPEEAREYDERRVRIGKLCSILGKFKANGKPRQSEQACIIARRNAAEGL